MSGLEIIFPLNKLRDGSVEPLNMGESAGELLKGVTEPSTLQGLGEIACEARTEQELLARISDNEKVMKDIQIDQAANHIALKKMRGTYIP